MENAGKKIPVETQIVFPRAVNFMCSIFDMSI